MSFGKRALNLLLAVAFLLFGPLPLGMLSAVVMMGATSIPPMLIALVAVLDLAVVAFCLWFGKSQGLFKLDKSRWSKRSLGIAGLAFVAMYLVSLLGHLLLELSGQTDTANQELLQKVFEQLPMALTFFHAVIAAPLVEEIACRALIPDAFSGKFIFVGHALGTLVFAYLHMPTNLGSWVIYAGMGAVLAFVRYRTGRLEDSILAHGFNNLFAFVIMMTVG